MLVSWNLDIRGEGTRMDIAIASDHAGFEQKEELKEYLSKRGYTVRDCGPRDDSRVDYPDYAAKLATLIMDGTATSGVLVCGTGVGMAIAANRHSGIRAVNATSPEFAELSRKHNDANVLCLSGRFVDLESNEKILDSFLQTDFEGGRHIERVRKLGNLP